MIALTAVPVAEGEDAWPADQPLLRYLDAGLPAGRVTVGSSAGDADLERGTFERVDW